MDLPFMSFATVWIWTLVFYFARTARVAIKGQVMSRAYRREDPPLTGCSSNYWNGTCCCFINFGILKQDRCQCAGSSSSCQSKVHLTYGPKPSRPIDAPPETLKRWYSNNGKEKGYLNGYQAVQHIYCMAAPVKGPQIDSQERTFECTCTTAMAHSVDMECGSNCDVENCKKWNPGKLDWSPFIAGRGKCCLSSYKNSVEGCPQQVDNVTESRAKIVVADALRHAEKKLQKAFVLKTSRPLIDDMTKSFDTAKKKKMATSRSGATFFFSGDNGYILKSIHASEYRVLQTIAREQKEGKTTLIDHIASRERLATHLHQAGNCVTLEVKYNDPILRNGSRNTPARRLSKALLDEFYGIWSFDEHQTEVSGTLVYKHEKGKYNVFHCSKFNTWRIQLADTVFDAFGCQHREYDSLFTWLQDHKAEEQSEEDVEIVFNNFLSAFDDKQPKETIVGNIKCRCHWYWWPASLINTFMLAFEYRASTWMVVRNSLTAVSKELENHGFTNFYKDSDVFDVKPLPIHSDERPLLFGMQFAKARMSDWRNWYSVRRNLQNDVNFMDHALDNPMVDYSLLINAYYINDERMALDHASLPNCVERRLSDISTIRVGSDYGPAQGSILVCFNVIDMLMELTFSKTPENIVLFGKWSDWSDKMMHMFDCLGQPFRSGSSCKSYAKMHQEYVGVDIPSIETARVKDVTELFDAEGVVRTFQHGDRRQMNLKTFKCCCHASRGVCKLVDITGKKKRLFDNPTGCGSAAGNNWHSFLRKASRCKIMADEAADLRSTVNLDVWIR